MRRCPRRRRRSTGRAAGERGVGVTRLCKERVFVRIRPFVSRPLVAKKELKMTRLSCVAVGGLAALGLGLGLGGCASHCEVCAVDSSAVESAHLAHKAYVEAINSNDLETVLAMMTDDVVFMPPNSERLVGKEAVRAWARPYLEAYDVGWEKASLELIVAGKYAIEQYAYVEDDTPRGDGEPLKDNGKGIIVYRLEDDGVWRVARDAWNSNLPGE